MISTNENLVGAKSAKLKSKRITVSAPKVESREQAESILREIAQTTNDLRAETAAMDAELLAIREDYAESLAELNGRLDALTNALSVWADAHGEIFPKDRKSVEWAAGRLGFRNDTPSLSPVSRQFTWAKILAVLVAKRWRRFIRTKLEVNKDAILARCGTQKNPTKFQNEVLPKLGLKLVQEEKFFVDPNLTDLQ